MGLSSGTTSISSAITIPTFIVKEDTYEKATQDAEKIVVTGRRTWKLMKGEKEAVWPPSLEAILLEALERYKPHSERPYSDFSRFPLRNRFISDYIYETTGKRRTPKQVGSRLQQLRDTCKKTKLLRLISKKHAGDRAPSEEPTDSTTTSSWRQSPTPPLDSRTSNVIQVDVILDKYDASAPLSIPVILLAASEMPTLEVRLSRSNKSPIGMRTICSPDSYACLYGRDPIFEFISPCPLLFQTIFSVFLEGHNELIHHEVGSLICQSSPVETHNWVYSSSLVPAFWSNLSHSKDPTKYTIQQSIIPLCPLPQRSLSVSTTADSTIILVYRFCFPETMDPIYNLQAQSSLMESPHNLPFHVKLSEKTRPLSSEAQQLSSHITHGVYQQYGLAPNIQSSEAHCYGYNANQNLIYPDNPTPSGMYDPYRESGPQQMCNSNGTSWPRAPNSKDPLAYSLNQTIMPYVGSTWG